MSLHYCRSMAELFRVGINFFYFSYRLQFAYQSFWCQDNRVVQLLKSGQKITDDSSINKQCINTTHETGKETVNGVVQQEDNLRLKDQHEFWNKSE